MATAAPDRRRQAATGAKGQNVELSLQDAEPQRAVPAASPARHGCGLPSGAPELGAGADLGAAGRLGLLAEEGRVGEPGCAGSVCVAEPEAGTQAEAGQQAPAGSEAAAAGATGSCAGAGDGSPRALQRALSDPQSTLFRTLSSVPQVGLCQRWVVVWLQAATASHPGSASVLSQCVHARACRPFAQGATRRISPLTLTREAHAQPRAGRLLLQNRAARVAAVRLPALRCGMAYHGPHRRCYDLTSAALICTRSLLSGAY